MNHNSTKKLIALGAVFLCLCFTSVKGDSIHKDRLMEELTHREQFRLELTEINRSESFGYFRNEESDNGKHLGFFTINSKHDGPRVAIVGYYPNSTNVTTQNPEPTTLVLLGTGLLAFAGYARRVKQKRRS